MGNVLDTYTGLIWRRCVAGMSGEYCSEGREVFMSWLEALEYAAEGTARKRSNVLGYSLHFEGGITFPLVPFQDLNSVRFGVMMGYRYNDIDRMVFRCEGCQEQGLDGFKNAIYLKPFIEYHYSTYAHGQFYFTLYLAESGFSRGFGLQISFYVP